MSLLEAIILGAVQGLTEFLPISSSGHLVLGEFLLKVKFDDISFEVFAHAGTFVSVVVVFRHTIWSMLEAVWSKSKSIFVVGDKSSGSEDWRLFWLIIAGSIPAGIAGLLLKDQVEFFFASVALVSFMLLFTGTVLLLTQFFGASRKKITLSDAFTVGLVQALAMVPGISRSGLTIGTGIFKGLERSKAAEFSFLLSLPAILGASLVELKEVRAQSEVSHNLAIHLVGAATAFVVGYLAIRFLLNMIKKGKFQYFGYYCLAVGLFFLILTV
ncbi:MAG: undecaprenyl-diphosphatase [candidate division Zixibacteria bacterium]|nr:undecaprenyl-diphosphatase [candidate division Zixibacteria bacterium]